MICHCRAYTYPHRAGGGRCTGLDRVRAYFATNVNTGCIGCVNRVVTATDHDCRVLATETPRLCPKLKEK